MCSAFKLDRIIQQFFRIELFVYYRGSLKSLLVNRSLCQLNILKINNLINTWHFYDKILQRRRCETVIITKCS